jgi:hypothetical protein
MEVTPSGMVTLVSPLQSPNASLPMEVTLKPSKVSGITKLPDASVLQPFIVAIESMIS